MRTLTFLRESFVLFVFAAHIASVKAAVTTSKLQVHIPQSLNVKDGYDHRDALFGIPPYGGSIQEKVYYADDLLCGPAVNTSKGYPAEFSESGERSSWKSPYILMVDRGDCTFVQKVRNAQRAGAAAVLIADSICLCGVSCEMNADQEVCETQEPIMADDGSGADISIPSFLVFKQDADKIKDVLKGNQPVRIEMIFSVPAPDSRVEYEVWMTPTDKVVRKFLQTFKNAAIALDAHAFFTPRMYIYDGQRAGCHVNKDGVDYCEGLCTNAGRYCATDPDGDLNSGVSGQDVVTESLRRTCIWKVHGDNGIGEEWWNYVDEFFHRCDDPEKPGFFTDPECISDAMKLAAVDKTKVEKCMSESGGLDGDIENSIFEEALKAKDVTGAVLIPSLFVNKAPVRGDMSFNTVFKAICAGYAAGSKPSVCMSCADCHDEENCVNDGVCSTDNKLGIATSGGSISTTTFVAALIGVSLLFGIFGYVLYQRQQRHMRDQIRGIMAEYMPIDPNKPAVDTSVSCDEFTIT